MATYAELLAERFLRANDVLVSVAEGCSSAQWQARCEAEGWTVGIVIHHVAGDYLDLLLAIEAIAAGRNVPEVTRESLDDRNARHARKSGSCSRAETVELLRRNAATVADMIRHLDDDQLARSGVVLGRATTVEQLIAVVLLGHIDGHLTSIRSTI
jgi:hypothetical protein